MVTGKVERSWRVIYIGKMRTVGVGTMMVVNEMIWKLGKEVRCK